MNKVKNWVKNANGWQRIWLVATALALFWATLVFPLQETNETNKTRYSYKWATEREMKNPACAEYMTKKFDQLVEPEFTADGYTGCYHIYNTRKYRDKNEEISPKSVDRDFAINEWLTLGSIALVGLIFVIVVSSIAYGAGKLVKWVIDGFKRSDVKNSDIKNE